MDERLGKTDRQEVERHERAGGDRKDGGVAALALAVGAIAVAGCGGGSSSSSEDAGETAGSGGSGASASQAAKTNTSASSASPGAGSKEAAAKPKSSGSDPESTPKGPAAKHGPRIVAPKGPTEQAPTPEQVAHATVADMSLESPAIVASGGSPGRLAATYTCDGKDSWPALHWGGVPAGTAELALFVMNVQPVGEQLFVDWAVAGLDPSLEEIKAGELPKGAIVGTNSFGKRGYSVCPPGTGEIYMFALYALPQRLSPAKGFDARELRKEILGVSGNVGLLPAVYERG